MTDTSAVGPLITPLGQAEENENNDMPHNSPLKKSAAPNSSARPRRLTFAHNRLSLLMKSDFFVGRETTVNQGSILSRR
jgi:hypothetical protein